MSRHYLLRSRLDVLLRQPVQHPLPQSRVSECEPGLLLVGMVREHVLETSEGAPATDRTPETILQALVSDGRDEVLHVLVAVARLRPGRRDVAGAITCLDLGSLFHSLLHPLWQVTLLQRVGYTGELLVS